jgi:hypothetical protein
MQLCFVCFQHMYVRPWLVPVHAALPSCAGEGDCLGGCSHVVQLTNAGAHFTLARDKLNPTTHDDSLQASREELCVVGFSSIRRVGVVDEQPGWLPILEVKRHTGVTRDSSRPPRKKCCKWSQPSRSLCSSCGCRCQRTHSTAVVTTVRTLLILASRRKRVHLAAVLALGSMG